MLRKLPIGIQGFVGLRNDGYIYVDKTDYIYQLRKNGKAYFLSRPRRFGKSLLLSTMKAYWQGKNKLFANLKIAELVELEGDNIDAWLPHPVFHFDFNGGFYSESFTGLESILDEHLHYWENEYNITPDAIKDYIENSRDNELSNGLNDLGKRFRYLVMRAYQQTSRRVVVLVDEYDKPLLEVMEQPELEAHNKAVFKGFFGSLKPLDDFLEFVFITGVTKFEKVSIFSDLNQLNDISFHEDFSAICGITENELQEYFAPEIEAIAQRRNITITECLERLKKQYDGYHFHQTGAGVYNPFSLLKAFFDKDFGSYQFSTGTPTFLVKAIVNSSFDIRKFTDNTLYANERMLSDYRADNPNLLPLLYQTGYLTIVDYDSISQEYTLSFPNREVKTGFLESLIPEYSINYNSGSGNDIFNFRRCVESGNLDGIRNILTALFASIPYTQHKSPFEHYFQSVIYILFTLLGNYVMCEMHTVTGRIDCIVKTSRFIYIFEFKRDGTVDEALKQIEDNKYALPFVADDRELYKIGVVFDSKERTLKDWNVAR